MLLQLFHLGLAVAASYLTVGALKWSKRGDIKVRGLDGIWTVLISFAVGAGYVWVLGWLAGIFGLQSGLNWLVRGLACYAVNGFLHEWFKAKQEKSS